MLKNLISQLLISLTIILIMTFIFIFIVIKINRDNLEKRARIYELSNTNSSLVQAVVYYLIKPILESALDQYIEKYDLEKHLKEKIYQEEEEDLVNFYEIIEGNGRRALCGQKVLLQIHEISADTTLATSFPQKEILSITTVIGQDNLKEISLGIIGIKEGGEGIVTIKSENNNKNINGKNFKSYYVKLVKIKDEYPDSLNNIIIFDDSSANNLGKQVKCGDKVLIKYNVMNHNGKYTIKDQIIEFKVGNKKVPLVIELGVVGMRTGSKRTIISPPELLNVTNDMLVGDIDLDKKNISIINLKIDAQN